MSFFTFNGKQFDNKDDTYLDEYGYPYMMRIEKLNWFLELEQFTFDKNIKRNYDLFSAELYNIFLHGLWSDSYQIKNERY